MHEGPRSSVNCSQHVQPQSVLSTNVAGLGRVRSTSQSTLKQMDWHLPTTGSITQLTADVELTPDSSSLHNEDPSLQSVAWPRASREEVFVGSTNKRRQQASVSAAEQIYSDRRSSLLGENTKITVSGIQHPTVWIQILIWRVFFVSVYFSAEKVKSVFGRPLLALTFVTQSQQTIQSIHCTADNDLGHNMTHTNMLIIHGTDIQQYLILFQHSEIHNWWIDIATAIWTY